MCNDSPGEKKIDSEYYGKLRDWIIFWPKEKMIIDGQTEMFAKYNRQGGNNGLIFHISSRQVAYRQLNYSR